MIENVGVRYVQQKIDATTVTCSDELVQLDSSIIGRLNALASGCCHSCREALLWQCTQIYGDFLLLKKTLASNKALNHISIILSLVR